MGYNKMNQTAVNSHTSHHVMANCMRL